MSEWIPYEGKGEKPEWLPDDCIVVVKMTDGNSLNPHFAFREFQWAVRGRRDDAIAFKIVDDRYQHLVPPPVALPSTGMPADLAKRWTVEIDNLAKRWIGKIDKMSGITPKETHVPTHLGHPWQSAQEAENCRVIEKAIGDEVVAAALGPIATEPAPVFEKVKYNVYRGAELLGTVEIEERPGISLEERKWRAGCELWPGEVMREHHLNIILHRVTASTGRRRGFIR